MKRLFILIRIKSQVLDNCSLQLVEGTGLKFFKGPTTDDMTIDLSRFREIPFS